MQGVQRVQKELRSRTERCKTGFQENVVYCLLTRVTDGSPFFIACCNVLKTLVNYFCLGLDIQYWILTLCLCPGSLGPCSQYLLPFMFHLEYSGGYCSNKIEDRLCFGLMAPTISQINSLHHHWPNHELSLNQPSSYLPLVYSVCQVENYHHPSHLSFALYQEVQL